MFMGLPRHADRADMIDPRFEVGLFGLWFARRPRHYDLRGIREGKQSLSASHTDCLIVGDFLRVIEGVRRLPPVAVALGERLNWQLRELLFLASRDTKAEADM